jgi:hypothetical protein
LQTYCARCNAKLTRPSGQQKPRVVCESRFCQGLEAQCQFCKTTYGLDEAVCPKCKDRGPLQKRASNTVTCSVCMCPCFASDIVTSLMSSGKPCGHGMCQSCVAEIVNTAIAQKSLVSLLKCPKSGCSGQYDVSQFQTALVLLQDPQTKMKMDELYVLQSQFTFISKQTPGDILL